MNKIELKELRLGNYFYDQISKKYCYVSSINHDGWVRLFVENGGDNISENFNIFDTIQPIELTEDVLLKCGFVRYEIKTISQSLDICKNTKLLEFELTDIGIDLWISCDDIDQALYFPINQIKYLHQLQNLYFALTNQELQITL